ncbi:MAG TPA: enoyl-CoA hydratase-related protein [Chloroflexota bacterium]|nr:enoyl-CoA hydratase-related protein [Chloroflexota bacterium]
MSYETLLVQRTEGILTVTINRPQVLNALNSQVTQELDALASEVEADGSVRAVIMTGAGDRAFVAGADINELHAMTGQGASAATYGARLQAVTIRWERLPKPLIAAVNGYALGGGCELAMAADVRIASENARFGQPEINLGIIPGAGGTQRLPRLVGKGYAKLMVLSGEPIDAQEALRIGLVQRVVPAERLMEEVRALAAKLAGKAPIALRLAKGAVDDGLEADIDRGLALEARAFGLSLGTKDAAEGTAAFLEKRPPTFTGQ